MQFQLNQTVRPGIFVVFKYFRLCRVVASRVHCNNEKCKMEMKWTEMAKKCRLTFQIVTPAVRKMLDNCVCFQIIFDVIQSIFSLLVPFPALQFVRVFQVVELPQTFDQTIFLQKWRKTFVNCSLVINRFLAVRITFIEF